MKRLSHKFLLLLCLCLSILASAVYAQDTQRDQPITIEADRVDVDDAKGMSVYRGNVILRQGAMTLWADELHLQTTAQRELSSVKAIGKPAKFKQEESAEAGELRGHALQITYDVTTEYMLFTGEAYFWQCGDEMSGDEVEYHGQQAVMKARKVEGGQGRVTVTLQPREDGQQTSPGCRK